MTCQGQDRKRKKPAQIVAPVFNSTTFFTFFEEIIVWCNHGNKFILGICLLISLKTNSRDLSHSCIFDSFGDLCNLYFGIEILWSLRNNWFKVKN